MTMTNATHASSYVTDTVALVLRLEQRKLDEQARVLFDTMEAGGVTIYVPAMVFAEILYLQERSRITTSLQDVAAYIERYETCQEYSLTQAVVYAASEIQDVPELHDRLIAVNARALHAALVTNDSKIQASKLVQTVW